MYSSSCGCLECSFNGLKAGVGCCCAHCRYTYIYTQRKCVWARITAQIAHCCMRWRQTLWLGETNGTLCKRGGGGATLAWLIYYQCPIYVRNCQKQQWSESVRLAFLSLLNYLPPVYSYCYNANQYDTVSMGASNAVRLWSVTGYLGVSQHVLGIGLKCNNHLRSSGLYFQNKDLFDKMVRAHTTTYGSDGTKRCRWLCTVVCWR